MSNFSDSLQRLRYCPYIRSDNPSNYFDNLDAALNSRVPQDYLDFLREFPWTGVFEIDGNVFVASDDKLSGRHDGHYSIDMLFAACSDKRYDLVEIAKRPVYDGDVPPYILLIGENVGGNAFGLDLRAEGFGQIYYWDHAHETDDDGLHLVAKDFSSFISSLRVET